jgi:hypothetical protein
MPYTAAARLLLLFAAILPSAALAAESPAAADIGITRGTAMTIPATPITTRAQLDATCVIRRPRTRR